MNRTSFVALIAVCGYLAGCGGGGETAARSTSTDAAPGSADASSAETSAEPVLDAKGCEVPEDGIPISALCVRSVRAKIIDDAGNPVANLMTTACSDDGCFFGSTDANGVTAVQLRRYMRGAALLLHGRATYASYYLPITREGDVDLGTLMAPRLPTAGVAVPSDGKSGSISSGEVTLTIPAGAKVEIDTLEHTTAEEQQFRAALASVSAAPPFVAPGANLVALYALAPFGTRITPGTGLSVKNSAKLPSGTAVEFMIHGTAKSSSVGFAGFGKVADGHVSADGSTITTDEGQSIVELSWVGVRLKGR